MSDATDIKRRLRGMAQGAALVSSGTAPLGLHADEVQLTAREALAEIEHLEKIATAARKMAEAGAKGDVDDLFAAADVLRQLLNLPLQRRRRGRMLM